MKKFRWDKKYLYWGVTAFLVICASILFYMFLNHLPGLKSALGKLGSILSPFIWGLVIAYLLYPLMKLYQRYLFAPLARRVYKKKENSKKKEDSLARSLAVFLAVVTLLIIIAAAVWLVFPQLYASIETIVNNSGTYLLRAYNWISNFFVDYPEIEAELSSAFGSLSNGIVDWAKNYLMPEMNNIITSVTSSVYYIVMGVVNVVIGVIVSVYILYNRESVGAHMKKLTYCIFSLEMSQKIINGVDYTNQVFMGFISGKILDSVIIGILCYIGCVLMSMPYAVLVAFLIGLFNIIPFFGPVIGTIPAALIILTEASLLKCLIFVAFIILLQQFDGNILGPKILGSAIGINGFWVMFSIIVGAGLFGFTGMLLGVPVFVVLYTFVQGLVRRKLKRSGLPTETEDYINLDHFDPLTGRAVGKSEVVRGRQNSIFRSKKKRRKKEEAKAAPSEEVQDNKTDDAGDELSGDGDSGPLQ